MPNENSIFGNFKLASAEYTEDKTTEKVDLNPKVDEENPEEIVTEKKEVPEKTPEKEIKKEEKIEKVDTNEDDVFSFTPIISHLSNNSILKPKENAEYEDSEKGLEDIVNDTVEAKLKEKISTLPDQVQKLIELGLEGVNVVEVQKFDDIDFKSIDLTDPENQVNLIFDHLTSTGHDKAEAEELIEEYKDANTLDKHTKIAHRVLAKKHEDQKNEFIETQKAEAKAKIESDKLIITNFKKEVLETEKIGDFTIPKAEREKLYDYMTKPVKEGKTQSQLDDTKENRLLLAYLRMKKFDVKDIETSVQTKKTIDLRKSLSRYKDNNAVVNTNEREEEVKISTKIPSGPWSQKQQ